TMAAGPVTATMVSRHGLRPRAGSPTHSLPMHSPPVIGSWAMTGGLCGVSHPLVADAQPAGHRPTAVGGEQLAVITGEYVERVAGEEWVEGAHLDAALSEPPPVAPRRAERAEGIVQDTHVDSGAGPLDQRVGETPAGR